MRQLLLFAYLVIFLGIFFVITHVRASRELTLSLHAASKPLTRLVFGLSLTVGVALLSAFVVGWLIPRYQLPVSFLSVFLFGVLSVVAVAWIPDTGRYKRAHAYAAYCVLAAQAAVVGLLLTQARLSPVAWVIAWLMLLGMLVISHVLFFKTRVRRQMLVLELWLFILFPVALAAAAYV